MYLLVFVAFVSTMGFYRRAKAVGMHPGKMASIPFIAWGLLVLFEIALGIAVGLICIGLGASDWVISTMLGMLEIFIMLAYLLLIRRYWLWLSYAKAAEQNSKLEIQDSSRIVGWIANENEGGS